MTENKNLFGLMIKTLAVMIIITALILAVGLLMPESRDDAVYVLWQMGLRQ